MKYFVFGFLIFFGISCDKDALAPVGEGNLYKLTTAEATNIGQNSVALLSTIINVANAPVISSRGVCWDSIPAPTIKSGVMLSGSGAGTYTNSISGLLAGKKYYARGFFKVLDIYYYGNEVIFTTAPLTSPVVGITSVSNITRTGASVTCAITSTGGGNIQSKLICWATTATPTINDKTLAGTGTNTYTVPITGLTPATTYYVRAYVKNEAYDAYSSVQSFRTAN